MAEHDVILIKMCRRLLTIVLPGAVVFKVLLQT
jgi:hypothetical protein